MSPTIKKLYYSISEVSEITELKAYVLRYWETEFSQLNPPKNRAGNRTYRQKDIEVILKIKDLLYQKKYTIDGARNFLKEKENVVKSTNESGLDNEEVRVTLSKIKNELKDILLIISK